MIRSNEQKAQVMSIEAEARLQATRSKYAALVEEGKSELKNIEAFEAQRRHNYELNKAKAYGEFVQMQDNIVISGKSGDALINQALDLGERQPQK